MKTVAGMSRGPCFHKQRGYLLCALLQVASLCSLGEILHALRKRLEEEPVKSETTKCLEGEGEEETLCNSQVCLLTSLLSSLWLCVQTL